MATSVVGSSGGNSTGTSHALAVPTHAVGDLLLAVFCFKSGTLDWTYGVALPSGWELVWNGYDPTGNVTYGVAAKIASSSEPVSYTFTTNARTAGAMLAIRGSSGIPYGCKVYKSTQVNGTYDADFATYSVPEDESLLIRACGNQANGPFPTTPTDYTIHQNVGGGGISLAIASRSADEGVDPAGTFGAFSFQVPVMLDLLIYPATRGSWVGVTTRNNNGGFGTTFSMTIPSQAQAGDLLIASGGGSIDEANLPSGWSSLSGIGYIKTAEEGDAGSNVTWTLTVAGGWAAFDCHAFRNLTPGANTRSDFTGAGAGPVSIAAGALTIDALGWRLHRPASDWHLNSGAYGVPFPGVSLGGDNFGAATGLALWPVEVGSDPGGTFVIEAYWGSNWYLYSAALEASAGSSRLLRVLLAHAEMGQV